jgi:hypothetical protein
MQLSNGEVCVLIDAAWGGLGPFSCQSMTSSPPADCHVPMQAAPWWTAACQSQETNTSPFTTYRVDTVWLWAMDRALDREPWRQLGAVAGSRTATVFG